MSINAELAAMFERMACVLDVLGENPFRGVSYRRAARALEELREDAGELARGEEPIKHLTAIDGIGKGLAQKIVEFITTGKIAEIDDAAAKVPPGVIELCNVPGVGPKTAASLWQHAGITSVQELSAKLDGDQLANLPRMGAKTIENIRKALAFAQSSGGRTRLGDAIPVALAIVERMRILPGVTVADFAGSLRRGKETIGDIDILVGCDAMADHAAPIGEAFRAMPGTARVLAAGPTKSSVQLAGGMQADLRVVDASRYGAALLYFTGSKEHNVALRDLAMRTKKLRLNEYGLWREDDFKQGDFEHATPVAAATEMEIYKALGLDWIPPELREDRGEIDAAARHALPKLIDLADVKAELHAHTTASDGTWNILELAEFYKARGYHTLAVTDHSVHQTIANGLDAKRLVKHIAAIRKAADQVKGLQLLAGSEVDILPDGSLDYENTLLAELDIVIASPHAALTQDPAKATDRLLRAIDNPYVHIIGHPTGRLINRRAGLDPDMAKLVKAAAAAHTALEINANTARLDLRDTHARLALEAGVKLSINTDAHGPTDADHLIFGILTARRAGAVAADVINTFSAPALRKWLKQKRPR